VILTKWERATKLSLEEAQPLRSLMIKNRAILDHLERPGADKFGIGVPSAWRKQGRVSKLMMWEMDEFDRIMSEKEAAK